MAGLVAAAEARSQGAEVLVVEKGDRPGGSMLLSSGVIWRHRDFERFRAECPDGDEALQRTLFERLDEDLDWLEAQGAPVTQRETGNPLTAGRRFDPRGVVKALAGDVRLSEPLRELPDAPVVLATGGVAPGRGPGGRHNTPPPGALPPPAPPLGTGGRARLGPGARGAPRTRVD